MNQRVTGILRGLGWGFYLLAALTAAALALDLAGLISGPAAFFSRISENAERVLIAALIGFFWIVFAALLIEFLRREITGVSRRARYGDALLTLGQSDAAVRFLPVVGTLLLVVLMNLAVFSPGTIDLDTGPVDAQSKLVFGFFYAVGHFLLFVFTLRAARNRPYFVLSKRGFIYEPGDVSPGLIEWQDVASIKETELLYGQTSYTGPGKRTALVVSLHDPGKYFRNYNWLLRALLAFLLPAIRYQAGGSGDLVLAADDFGARYEEVKGLISRFVKIETEKS